MNFSNLAYYKFFYDMGFYTEEHIRYATKHCVLTRAEYKIITGKDYIEQ